MGLDRTLWYQYYSAVCVNIITISYGAFCGWPSASFLELQAIDSPLDTGPMTNAEAGLVGAILCAGGLMGTIFFSWYSERYGRKRCLLLVAAPSCLGWLIISIARTPMHLCFARFFGGFAGGGAFSVIPIYITEFSETRIRGTLGSLIVLFCNFGILWAFVLGHYFSYVTVAHISLLLVVIFLLSFSFLPESPQYLMKSEKPESAEKALRYFRNLRGSSKTIGCEEEFRQALDNLKSNNNCTDDKCNIDMDSNSIGLEDFVNPPGRKALMIGIVLMLLNPLSGGFALINYAATIFQESGSQLSPNKAAIVVGVIQLIGSYISTVMVERAGRRILLFTSALATGFGLLCLGGYGQLVSLGVDMHAFNWLPLVSFSITILAASWGVLALSFLVVSEIMPPKIRNIGSMICMVLLWTISFFVLMCFPIMSEILGMHGVMFIFAANCFLGAIFVIKFLPETKGKSIETILAML